MPIFKNEQYEPKVKNRWITYLPKEFDLHEWVLFATQRPIIKIENGHVSYEPLELIFRDPIGPSTTQALWNLVIGLTDIDLDGVVHEKLGDDLRKKLEPFKAGFDYKIEMLDPIGDVIERWQILGCRIVKIDFGELDYDIRETCRCTLLIQPTKVMLEF